MKPIRQLTILTLLVLLSACQTTGDQKGSLMPIALPSLPGMNTGPKQVEISSMPGVYRESPLAMGRERDVNDYRVRGEGLVPIPVLTGYLNNLLERIKRETGIPNLPGTVYVTSSEGLDAFATPDANIFLGIGFLKNLDTEDQIVAILAHELAHIIYGHHATDEISNTQKKIQSATTMAMNVYSKVNLPGKAASLPKPAAMKSLQKMQQLIELTDIVLLPAWSRRQEDQADALALDLSLKMGYSYGRGMKSMLELLTAEEDKLELKKAQKKAQLEAQIGNEFITTGTINVAKAAASIFEILKENISNRHDDGVKRMATVNAYYEKFYEDKPPPTRVHAAEWMQILNNRSVAQTVANYQIAFDADTLRLKGDYPKALILARQAASGPTADHPMPLRVLANVLLATGDQRAFSNTLALTVKAPEPSWKLIKLKADDELIGGKQKDSKQTMEAGYRFFKEPPNLRPTMIAYYKQIDDKTSVDRLKTECNFESPEKRELCDAAAK